jgi:hypothetical protein
MTDRQSHRTHVENGKDDSNNYLWNSFSVMVKQFNLSAQNELVAGGV